MPDPIYLRPEAGPIHWKLLDDAQWQAFNHMLNAIYEAVKRLPDPGQRRERGPDDPAQWLNQNRSSQILFVDGARGTGKTTVLTSLVDVSQDENETPAPEVGLSDEQRQPSLKKLEVMRRRVVWLEPLDMEPAPPSLNLLPAILARIDAATYRHGLRGEPRAGDREREYHGLLEPASDLQDAGMQLQRFQATAALAWQSNLDRRAGSLDPDSYAVEVMRVERARLSVNHTFQTVLDGLANSAFRGSAIRSPLFVLPVDDFDLNPTASLALLQLLRMISVPRLFSVVLGDLKVAEMIANLKLSSDLAAVAEPGLRAQLVSTPVASLRAVAADLAANVLRKLIPPGQRINLHYLDLTEALNFRPLGSAEAEPRLHGVLGSCTVSFTGSLVDSSQTRPNRGARRRRGRSDRSLTAPVIHGVKVDNLRDFLLVPSLSPTTQAMSAPARLPATRPYAREIFDVPYSGVTSLLTSPRRMTDLWLALRQPADASAPTTPTESVDVIAEYCRLALAEERAFDPEQAEVAVASIQREPSGEWRLGPLPVLVTPQLDPWQSFPLWQAPQLASTNDRSELPAQIHLRRHRGWLFGAAAADRASSPTPAGSGGVDQPRRSVVTAANRPLGRALSEQTAGALTLFHDLVALGTQRRGFVSPLLGSGTDVQKWVVVEVPGGSELDESGLASPRAGVELPWPAPPFESFWELDLFLPAWEEASQEVSGTAPLSEFAISNLVLSWIAAGTAVLVVTGGLAQPSLPPVWPTPQSWGSWEGPMAALVQLADAQSRSGRKVRDWLISIALLLMPECGLPPGTLGLSFPSLARFWGEDRQAGVIRQRRYERLSAIAAAGRPTLAEALRKADMPGSFEQSAPLFRPDAAFVAPSRSPSGAGSA